MTPNHLEYASIESFQSYKDPKLIEKAQVNIGSQRTEMPRYDRRGRVGNVKSSNNKDIFGRLQRLVQGTNKGFFEASRDEKRGETGRFRREGGFDSRSPNGNYSQVVGSRENAKRYGQREQNFNMRGEESFPQSYNNTNDHINFNYSNEYYDTQDFEGTSPEFLQSLGFKSFTEVGSPNKSVSYSEILPSKEQGKNPYQKSRGQAGEFSYKQGINIIENEGENEGLNIRGYKNARIEEERVLKEQKGNMRIDGVSDKANEVINSLLGDLGNSGIYHSLMKKLEEKSLQSPSHFKFNKEKSALLGSQSPMGTQKETQTNRVDIKAEEISEIRQSKMEGKKDTLLNEFSLGGRTEKYVSVNMIKRHLESNEIFAEDIVDEVFRYLEDNVVNKNYFMQVMSVS